MTPLERLTELPPAAVGAQRRGKAALGGFRKNLVTLVETFRLALDAPKFSPLIRFPRRSEIPRFPPASITSSCAVWRRVRPIAIPRPKRLPHRFTHLLGRLPKPSPNCNRSRRRAPRVPGYRGPRGPVTFGPLPRLRYSPSAACPFRAHSSPTIDCRRLQLLPRHRRCRLRICSAILRRQRFHTLKRTFRNRIHLRHRRKSPTCYVPRLL